MRFPTEQGGEKEGGLKWKKGAGSEKVKKGTTKETGALRIYFGRSRGTALSKRCQKENADGALELNGKEEEKSSVQISQCRKGKGKRAFPSEGRQFGETQSFLCRRDTKKRGAHE